MSLVYSTCLLAGARNASAGRIALVSGAALEAVWHSKGLESPGSLTFRWLFAFVDLLFAYAFFEGVRTDTLRPDRQALALTLVLGSPALAMWLLFASYDTRLLSPAWPALLAIIGLCFGGLFSSEDLFPASRRARMTALAALAGATFLSLPGFDGLDRSTFAKAARCALSPQCDLPAIRLIILGSRARAIQGTESIVGTDGRVVTQDGAFRFFFPGRTDQFYPASCQDLVGRRVLAFLDIPSVRDYYKRALGTPRSPADFLACEEPRVTSLGDYGEYKLFRIDKREQPAP